MRQLSLALAACLFPTLAAADADAIVAAGAKLCTERDSGTFTSDGAVRNLDLTGDGRADTVVDEALFKCSTAADLFAGPAGSKVHLLAEGTESSYLVQGWDTAIWTNRQLVLLALQGTDCGAEATDPCFEVLTWGGKGFLSVRPAAQ
ncbi:MAG: hypothetical protein DI533_13940 [Cereibacter sphaeroides]|uniref:Uncharacterized protein n=1 Tax=Cereibacter sphaeroides TaxID=1063 RepID=A0A2W5S178_CERSP|nr:MAG: hypothetical protein DI533_13940 [Cereibacter sphaeroides]